MLTRTLLLGAAASLALGATANATEGWYIGLEGGANWIDDTNAIAVFNPDTLPTNTTIAGTINFDTGWAVLATVGYGFGGNWRMEFEAGYRNNDVDTTTTNVELAEWSAMLNVLYDIPLTQSLDLTLGAGAGADFANFKISGSPFDDDDWNFAYQGIAGISYALGNNLDLTVTYRYFRVVEPDFADRVPVPAPGLLSYALDDVVKHTATIGLRYSFGRAAPEPVVAPPPPPPPAAVEPTTPREYIVFFGHNKWNLTNEALDVVRQAAAAAKEYGAASILVVGHADRSGSAKYNEKLSLRRANTVKGALVADGISAGAVTVSARGESDPMVPTADGVREPQNRRVHISL